MRVDDVTINVSLLGLGLVALLPFPTSLLAEYGDQPQAVAIYAAAVALATGAQLALLLAVWKRPGHTHRPIPPPLIRSWTLDLGGTVAVFAVTIPLAFVLSGYAELIWLALIPLKISLGRRSRRLERGLS